MSQGGEHRIKLVHYKTKETDYMLEDKVIKRFRSFYRNHTEEEIRESILPHLPMNVEFFEQEVTHCTECFHGTVSDEEERENKNRLYLLPSEPAVDPKASNILAEDGHLKDVENRARQAKRNNSRSIKPKGPKPAKSAPNPYTGLSLFSLLDAPTPATITKDK
jgi:hypothetical protein